MPQFEKYPEHHHLANEIMLAGSACKQNVHRADGLKPVDLVNHFAEIYWVTKDIKTMRKRCPYPSNLEIVYPSPDQSAPAAAQSGGSDGRRPA